MAVERVRARRIVLDTGPLITPAAADRFDDRLLPGLPVVVRDAVLFGATGASWRLGAQRFLPRPQAREGGGRAVATEGFHDSLLLREARPGSRQRGVDARAARKVRRHAVHLAEDGIAPFLLGDERVVGAAAAPEGGRVVPMTARVCRVEPGRARRINPPDDALRRAAGGGWLASRREAPRQRHERALAAVPAALAAKRT